MKLPAKLNKARKLTDEDIQRIYDLYSFGESKSSIAKELGVTRYAVYHHIYKKFFPEMFAEMTHRRVLRNRNYKNKGGLPDYLKRLRLAHGKDKVSVHRQKIKDKWVAKNRDKYLEQRRKYRAKNKKRINANWMKNYYKKRAPLLGNK